VKINLKLGFEPLLVKQFHKLLVELKIKDEFVEEFSKARYIRPGNKKALVRDMFISKKNGIK
jgi:hypothetical protein